ncbi:16S rRNA (uracil(1498)-N(3))-methyltransferase [Psychrobacter sp. FDAARGOS_221]|uniref:16S rRNA (uracil(1498)-N(3))-methyltransferase n=1 Tax=Psychrobacter sp. FDAARGOS_221 TaxID=1975705 RepID=UPI000BB5490D|nr:16S rRNA (uracil(1498)-N(3))-methyltransferase [Psychrobacter sp. FDAARGOS_221]PNK61677.1 16S rRNA (uracil(1498)-N(3))-methyltransferase [Psychrobacter sp. FDAARGOS_221]
MRRFFYPAQQLSEQPDHLGLQQLPINTELTLPDDVYHHWCRVLRAKVGEQSVLFDGLGGETVVELVAVDKKTATARVLSHDATDNTSAYYSTIALVMSRGDRMDYAIQKATELGATAIQLLSSQHGEVRLKANQVDKKLNHWQQVALSACEQCGLNRPPLVLSPLSIEDWLQQNVGDCHSSVSYLLDDDYYQTYFNLSSLALVLAVPSQQEQATLNANQSIKQHLAEYHNKAALPRFDLLIGAEGGLSDNEYQLSRQANYLPWQLGNRVLRTETAPVVALATLMTMANDANGDV